jgi:hypothetical protein
MTEMPIIDTEFATLRYQRSEFLDGFADLEAGVMEFLRKLGKQTKDGGGFAQRLKAFKELQQSSQLPTKNLARRDSIHEEIVDILRLRADLVHSRMEAIKVDGVVKARFVNVMDQHEKIPPCRILSQDDFISLAQQLKRLKSQISSLHPVNPASSPQPPSPGAAGDP